MGLFSSKSSSSSSTTNLYETDNSNVAAEAGGDAFVFRDARVRDVSILDGGAVAGSLNFARDASAGALDTAAGAFDTAAGAFGGALDFASDVYARGVESLQSTFKENAQLTASVLAKQTVDSGERVEKTVKMYGWFALAAIVGVVALQRFGR